MADESEAELRAMQAAANAQVNALRKAGKGAEARELRQGVLRLAALADAKQQERYAEYERIAETADASESVVVAAEMAAAVSAAEALLKG